MQPNATNIAERTASVVEQAEEQPEYEFYRTEAERLILFAEQTGAITMSMAINYRDRLQKAMAGIPSLAKNHFPDPIQARTPPLPVPVRLYTGSDETAA